MKRLLIGSLAVALVVMFAMPAAAEFHMGVMAYTDVGYRFDSDERSASGDSQYNAFVDLARHSRLYGRWSEENMGAYMELGMGSGGPSSGGADTNFRKLYGFYKFGDWQITAGHTEALGASRYNASQLLGFNENNHIIMLGFGNLYQRVAQVDIEYRAGMWYFGFGINTPSSFGLEGSEYSPMWKLAGVGGIRTKHVWVTLDGMINIASSDGEPQGADSSATAWAGTLVVDLKFNILDIRINPFYGQNIGNLGYGLLGAAANVQYDAAGQVEDTDSWGGYIDVTIGGDPFLVHLLAGYHNDDNELYNDAQEKYAFGARGAWKVAKNFTLSPEVMYYSYGDDVFTNDDLGNEWLAGVQFQFVF